MACILLLGLALLPLRAFGAGSRKPDLAVKVVTGPSTVRAGARFVVRDAVANGGRAPSGRSYVGYHLSRDRKLDRRDVRLRGSRSVKALKVGRRSRGKVRLTLPAGVSAGSYWLLACADARKRAKERNERNNCRAARRKLLVTRAAGPVGPPTPVPGGGLPPRPVATVTPAPSPAPTSTPTPQPTPGGGLDTTITAGASGTLESTTATFDFGSATTGATFECRLAADAFEACESPTTLTGLTAGAHSFEVRAVSGGDRDPSPAVRTWTVVVPTVDAGPTDTPAADPAGDASPSLTSGFEPFGDSTAFLFEGADPIQVGVAAGTMDAERVAVLRGQVDHRMGGGLAGVRVSVLDHPELGRTSTRDDGGFDLAVNGGGPLVLRYERSGYIPAQRQVDAPWQDYAPVEDVVMVPWDTEVTEVDLSSTRDVQVARGSQVTDGDGERQATLLFSEGTRAEMVMPDGEIRPLTTLHVRATEFTIGDSGPEAMPGQLPPTSGYTYASELSVDEAVEAGAEEVRFDRPVVTYVENFLEFPAGGAVPVGSYDRASGRWVAAPNGRVIDVVGETGGRAELDVDGDGAADDPAALAALGITAAERVQLAGLYEPGQSLWRVGITHFTPWDCNWPFAPPPDAIPPDAPPPNTNRPKPKKECYGDGSVIGCQSQRLGETLAVTGTPFELNYWSDRVPGRVEDRSLEIPVTGGAVPGSLLDATVEVNVAGRFYTRTFAPAPDIRYQFTWDGIDAYGRLPIGPQPATIRLIFRYNLVRYATPAEFTAAFGRLGGARFEGDRRSDFTVSTSWRDDVEGAVGNWDARSVGLGGWTLDAHHAYDERSRAVHMGDGRKLTTEPVIGTVAGASLPPSSSFPGAPEGQQARGTSLGYVLDVAAAPDGSFYVAAEPASRVGVVWRVRRDGVLERVGGGGGSDADGIPARDAALGSIGGLSAAADGSLYLTQPTLGRVRRIDPSGTIATVAGGGTSAAEGVPATAAQIVGPLGVAAAPDGSFYVSNGERVRQVGTDGRIVTIAGGGTASGDGGPAIDADVSGADGLAIAADGSLYIGHDARLRRVDPGGTIHTTAGGGRGPDPIEGGPATANEIGAVRSVAVGKDGAVYLADSTNRVRKVLHDGTMTTFAGGRFDSTGFGEGGPPSKAFLFGLTGIAIGPDGTVFVAHGGRNASGEIPFSGLVRQVSRPLAADAGDPRLLPSPDGAEAYEFDGAGRHLRTLDGLTGEARLTFAYDAERRLASVTDLDGNVTRVERDGAGRPVALIAPGGQRTALESNADGYLSRVADPAGGASAMTYTSSGLMTALTDPGGGAHAFEYDGKGFLTRDEDADGGIQTLARTELERGYRVDVRTALGRTTSYTVRRRPEGGLELVSADPAGATTSIVSTPDGGQTATFPDGATIDRQTVPDPRWGYLAPVTSVRRTTTPGGRTELLSARHVATLTNGRDPFSVETLGETTTTNGRTSTTVYDADTRAFTATSPEGRESVTVLDARGRVVRAEPGAGLDPITFAYDGNGLTSEVVQGPHSWTFEHDARGRVVARTDALGRRTEFEHDDADRVTDMMVPSGRTYRFASDENGNRTGVTMPDGDSHALGYTAGDRFERFTPAGSAASETRAFNADHQLTTVTLPGGREINHAYDAGGRPGDREYDASTATMSYAGNTRRASTMVRTPAGGATAQSTAFLYDADLPTRVTHGGPASGRFDYVYDDNLRLMNVTLTSGTVIDSAITRDDDGLVTGFGPFTFERAGPAGAANRIHDGALDLAFTHDGRGQVAGRTETVAGEDVYGATITRDAAGRISRKVETVDGVGTTWDYTYDADGRLLGVDRDTVAAERYEYDQNGNRTSRRRGLDPAEAVAYDEQERVASRGLVGYDFGADGFLSGRGSDSFEYSATGELLQATIGAVTVSYAYDALGRRVARTQGSDTTEYLYGNPGDPFEVTAARSPSGELSQYYYDEAGLLYAIQRGASRYYVATDQVGTPRVVTDAAGAVVKVLVYDSFGEAISDSAPAFDLPFGFAGGLSDPVTGLVRFGFRDYEPQTGRWTARDPILFQGGQANLYAYAGSDPVGQRDPTGLACFGGSFYSVAGLGSQLCITDEGLSLCGEIGLGFGTDVNLDLTGDLADTGVSAIAEAKAKFGSFEGKVGLELDSSGCLSGGPEFKAGPLKLTRDKTGVEVQLKESHIKVSPRAGVQAKLAAKACRRWAF